MKKELRELLQARAAKVEELKVLRNKLVAGEIETRAFNTDFEKIQGEIDKIDEKRTAIEAADSILERSVDIPVITRETDLQEIETMSREEVLDHDVYKRAFFKTIQRKNLSDEEKRFYQVGTNPSGNQDASPAVPTTTWNKIIDKLEQTNLLLSRVFITTVKGDLTIPVEDANSSAEWKDEGVAQAGTSTLGEVLLKGYELVKNITVSKSAMLMTISDFEAWIIRSIVRKINVALEAAIANGDGTKKATGILQSSAIPTYTFTGGVTYDTLLAFVAVLATSYQAGSVVIMNRLTFFNNVKTIKDNDGRPIFHSNIDSSSPFLFEVFGYPVLMSDYYPAFAAAAATDPFITHGNLEFYHLNFQQTLELTMSTEAKFLERQVVYQGCLVADGNVVLGEAFTNGLKSV